MSIWNKFQNLILGGRLEADTVSAQTYENLPTTGTQIATGNYAGDGAEGGKTIVLPFTPKHIEIYGDDGGAPPNRTDFIFHKNDQMAGANAVELSGPMNTSPIILRDATPRITIIANGMTVDGLANMNGGSYEYTAWG